MGNQKESPWVLLLRALPPAVMGSMVFQIAILVGGLILGAVVLGLFLDARLGTRPLLTLGLAIASLPLSVWLTYRLAMRTVTRARAAYEAYARQKRQPAEAAAEPLPAQALKADRP